MFDYKKLVCVTQILFSLSCVAMDQQQVTITDLPRELIQLIGQCAAHNNIKDVFRLIMANKTLCSAFSKKDLVKLLTLERITKAIACEEYNALAKQNSALPNISALAHHMSGIDSFSITSKIKRFDGPPKPNGLCSESDVPLVIQSVLNYSIYMGHHSMTRLLLEAGVLYDDMSLLVAIAAHNVSAVKLLLEMGVDQFNVEWRTSIRPEDLAWRGMDNAPVDDISTEELKAHKEIYKLLQNAKCRYVFKTVLAECKGPILAVVVVGCAILLYCYR